MEVYNFVIPAEATRREYAVYLIVLQERATRSVAAVYVGKVGDNREGCNPVASRVGNHLSFNKLHSQTRNRFANTENYDFRVFYTFFGPYVPPRVSRDGIDLVNEMERQLNVRAHAAFGALVANPLKGTGWVPQDERKRRAEFCTTDRMQRLDALVEGARAHIEAP